MYCFDLQRNCLIPLNFAVLGATCTHCCLDNRSQGYLWGCWGVHGKFGSIFVCYVGMKHTYKLTRSDNIGGRDLGKTLTWNHLVCGLVTVQLPINLPYQSALRRQKFEWLTEVKSQTHRFHSCSGLDDVPSTICESSFNQWTHPHIRPSRFSVPFISTTKNSRRMDVNTR